VQGAGRAAHGVIPGLKLDIQERRVAVQDEAQRIQLRLRFGGLGLRAWLLDWILVQIPQSLLVFVQPRAVIARLKGRVAEGLAFGGDLQYQIRVGRGGAILGEVFVRVTEVIRGFCVGGEGSVASKLAAVDDDGGFAGLVSAFGLEVLDLADDGLAVEDFAEDDVLVVEVGGGYRGDEELGAVGI
jgi:hypothetical protein